MSSLSGLLQEPDATPVCGKMLNRVFVFVDRTFLRRTRAECYKLSHTDDSQVHTLFTPFGKIDLKAVMTLKRLKRVDKVTSHGGLLTNQQFFLSDENCFSS